MRRPRPGIVAAGLAAFAGLAGLQAACAENARPGLGALRLGGAGDDSFVTPVLLPPPAPFVYPPDAWARGVGGEALLRIRISATGRVDSVEIVDSAGDAVLDSAALASALGLRFRPARRGDDAVPIWGVLPVLYPMPAPAAAPDG